MDVICGYLSGKYIYMQNFFEGHTCHKLLQINQKKGLCCVTFWVTHATALGTIMRASCSFGEMMYGRYFETGVALWWQTVGLVNEHT